MSEEKVRKNNHPRPLTDEERRRRARIIRKRREAQRRRRIKILTITSLCGLALILLLTLGVSNLLKGRQKKVNMNQQQSLNATDSDIQKPDILKQADHLALHYDYEGAVRLLEKQPEFSSNEKMQAAKAKYEKAMESLVEVNPDEITHVFYHSLVVDPERGFAGAQGKQFNMWMTTLEEFNKITQSMYDKGYVLIRMRDMVEQTTDSHGNVKFRKAKIMLPPDKKPFVLSLDDLSYYHSYDGYGVASKLVLDKNGRVTCEYIDKDGKTLLGSYDCAPLIDDFIREHPDFSYKGARGIIALTGYNGILGYRTDQSYEDRPDDLDDDKVKWLNDHPDFSLEKERAEAKKVAEAMKKEGWEFASHTWGHQYIGDISLEKLQTDTQKWLDNVAPLVGGTDTIVFAHGQDLASAGEYTGDNEKYNYLKSKGFHFYCNVDGSKYFVQITDNYVRQGRRNLDGYRMYHNPDMVADLFDAAQVFDKARPTPVASE